MCNTFSTLSSSSLSLFNGFSYFMLSSKLWYYQGMNSSLARIAMSSPYPLTIYIMIMIITPSSYRAHRALKYWASLWLPVDVVFVARFLNQNNSRFFNEIVVLATSSCNQRWREKQENIRTKPTGLISKIKQSAFEVHFLADSFAIIARLTLSNFIGMAMRSSLSSALSRRDFDFIWNTGRAAQYSRTLPYC